MVRTSYNIEVVYKKTSLGNIVYSTSQTLLLGASPNRYAMNPIHLTQLSSIQL